MIIYVNIKNMLFYFVREVFKAKDKKNQKRTVAMKKILMENEKEGVSLYLFYKFEKVINIQ